MPVLPTGKRRFDALLWAAIAVVHVMLGWLSVARYTGYNVGMLDLGNMAQAIWSGTQNAPLVFSHPSGQLSRLAGHVELIYFLLVPFYRLWPDPRLLVLLQAGLFVAGTLPAYALTLRRTGNHFAARCVALIYLLYPTAQTSVLFDLHGDTLALPLLMFALDALDAQRWWRYTLYVGLALSCKFYVAVPVLLLGMLLVWRGERRVGMLTAGAAGLYGALAFLVIRPLFAATTTVDQRAPTYLDYYFGQLASIGQTLPDRILSAIVVFGPALLVAWRGWRWLLPGLSVACAALLSTGPAASYDFRYHHYALVVPFIVRATIDGVAKLRMQNGELRKKQGDATISAPIVLHSQFSTPHSRRGRSWRGDLGLTVAIVVIFNVALVDTPLNPLFWLRIPGQGRDHSAYGVLPRDAVKDEFLQQVPANTPIAASNQLAAHLANRETLYLLRYPDEARGPERLPRNLPNVDYVVSDALFDYYIPLDGGYGGGLDGDRAALDIVLRDGRFGLMAMRDGLLLFQRNAPPDRVLTNTLALLPDHGAPAEQIFGESIALVRHSLTPLGSQRWRATFVWRLTGSFKELGRFVAVSQLDGVSNARFVHLPSYALHPAWTWQREQLVQETFDVELPADITPGEYTWRTGWYNVGLATSYATDARSLLPSSVATEISRVTVP